ncbi:MAG: phosphatase PAP2 family protein [Thermoguttaceae bacterium]
MTQTEIPPSGTGVPTFDGSMCDDMWRRGGRAVVSAVRNPFVWIPALLLLTLTLYFRFSDADIVWLRPFFAGVEAGDRTIDRWPMGLEYPWRAFYRLGVYPALLLGFGGFVVWCGSFYRRSWEPYRDAGLFLFLLLLIGPGIVVNGILKPFWGRPRPNAVEEFGGPRVFLPVWQHGGGQIESSFPSGHASMGFFLMAPAFICYRRRPRLAFEFLLLGLVAGCSVGLARMVAGGHFPSDVLWAGGFVYFLGLMIAAPFRFGDDTPPFWKRGDGRTGESG